MMKRPRPTRIAVWAIVCLLGVTAAIVVSVRLPTALSRSTQAREVVRLETELTSLGTLQQSLAGQAGIVESNAASNQARASTLARETLAQAARVRSLRAQVASLNRKLNGG
jgi:hypothetical protein